ncbi:MAG: hypothetical protein ABWZ98_15850 [Nakamurella sp.]
MTTPAVRRPALVTLVVVLTVIGGIGSIISGIIALTVAGGLAWAGVILIGLGAIYLAVAKGLADGNPLSRLIVAVVALLQVVVAVFTMIGTDSSQIRNSAIGSAIVGVILLLILFSPKANAFFGSRSS